MDQAEFQDWMSSSDRLASAPRRGRRRAGSGVISAKRAAVAKDAVLVTDAALCYPPCARSLGLSHIALNQSADLRIQRPCHRFAK